MDFGIFIRTRHSVIGNKPLYDFTVEFFESSTYDTLYLNAESVKNWLRSNKRNRSYIKYLNANNFNVIEFNTFLKARTMGSWKTLQNTFHDLQKNNPECLIHFTTNNHDQFLESIEWQFKAILRIPIE
ncbi:MAG: hypothetical protein FWC16_14955 [Defluviitaleaceae bacterium]|nr:hypothetical protein [Defluviitaleaceae bacterium]MCL2276215.1 hypothetical protein [Defluviitaleaceae bacterium]